MPESEILVIADDDFDEVIADAAELVRDGLVIGLPTDTVYVLVADPFDPGPTERLFSLKHRPRTQDLSELVGGLDQALGLLADERVAECARADVGLGFGPNNEARCHRWPSRGFWMRARTSLHDDPAPGSRR